MNDLLKNLGRLPASIAICQSAGIVGSIFTAPAIGVWYEGLKKPTISPPNWLFAPVWLTLFTLMGISLFLVWRRSNQKNIRSAIIAFGIQLGLNALWSFLFFGLESPFLGLLGIIALLIAIALTIVLFFRISKAASILLIPYIVWVAFAAVLNVLIFKLN